MGSTDAVGHSMSASHAAANDAVGICHQPLNLHESLCCAQQALLTLLAWPCTSRLCLVCACHVRARHLTGSSLAYDMGCTALGARTDLRGGRRAQALPQLQAKLRIERARMRLRLLAPLGAKPELERLLAAQGATIEYQDLGLNGQQVFGC